MLKFYVGIFGGSDPKEMIPDAVLKTYIYNEQTSSAVLTLDSLKRQRRGLILRNPVRVGPTVSNRLLGQDAEAAGLLNINLTDIGTTGSGGTGMRERDYVVRFNGNGYLAGVDLRTDEARDKAQKDLRFRATLRSDAAEGQDATGMPVLQQWMCERQAGGTTLVAADGGKVQWADFNGYNVQAIFYLEQLEGFFGVAELVKKDEPTKRRLLVSIHVHEADDHKQRTIVTPEFDVTNLDELYTVGFLQDTDGDQSRLEFYVGRDDNFGQFATYDLAPDDRFFFRRAVGSENTEVGIGCWPASGDQQALQFTGDIKEIICDPWGECTAC